jgi:hypothetical protein
MLLALQIVGIIYIVAVAVLSELWREAFHRSTSSPDYRSSRSNVIPFRRGSVSSAGGKAGNSQVT